MNAWIVYDQERYNRNQIFAKMLKDKLENKGVKTEILITPFEITETPSFVIMRTFDSSLSEKLEQLGVLVFNNSKVSAICNDKWKTYEYFKTIVPMIPTSIFQKKIVFPKIVKSRAGHGGSEVFLIKNSAELSKIKMRNDLIIQELADFGKDLRVYVIGKKIITSILRTSSNDFRSNYSLGGTAVVKKISIHEKRIVKKIVKNLNVDFVGIDFVYRKNKAFLNEIEDIVGSRMVYKVTNIDIVDKYINYIIKNAHKKSL